MVGPRRSTRVKIARMKNIKAAFFDFDWTLFDHRIRQFTPSSISALNRLHQNGVLLFLDSARNQHSLKGLGTYNLIPFDGAGLNNGGAAITKDGKTLYQDVLNQETLSSLIGLCEKRGLSYLLVNTKKTYRVLNSPDDPYYKAHYSVFYEYPPVDVPKNENIEGVICFQVFCPESYDREFQKLGDFHFNRFAPSTFEITASSFQKGKAVDAFLKEYGIKKEEAIAFGDDLNDIDMFRHVGTSVCLGNGKEEAKLAATLITDDMKDGGIKNALIKLGLID